MATCPVCGKPADETTSPFTEYEGRMYYFACPACKMRFDQDPQRFLTGGPESHHHHEHYSS